MPGYSNETPKTKCNDFVPNSNQQHTKITSPLKTESMCTTAKSDNEPLFCHYHNSNHHNLTSCQDFRKLPYSTKRELIYSYWLCNRCQGYHPGNDTCNIEVQCDICMLKGHLSVMHIDKRFEQSLRHGNKISSGADAESISHGGDPNTSINTSLL